MEYCFYYGSDSFLSDWMGQLLPVLGASPLLALSLPGTHDTLTYDLSTTVSEGGIDEYYKLAEMLHDKTDLVPGQVRLKPDGCYASRQSICLMILTILPVSNSLCLSFPCADFIEDFMRSGAQCQVGCIT